ncbi:MAPEG family protein [Thalassotalea agarivorans]|uniref:MAPEG family protein n=1 Tax=Thalassotalea agarivorans TaxID=349064 RepID=A0A1I0CSW9_THASX|nr:MAPEG family protein [Thalassotalea agarivorans]SET22762.1 MAPEG family protein [Thalassotalea agarivorans]
MSLTAKQKGVLKGMLIGFLLALSILVLGSNLNPFNFNESLGVIDRLQIAILWCLVPILFLTVSIGRLARHRFFTPQDIDGSGLTEGTEQAKLLQALIQNTLEQTILAVMAYFIWSVAMPSHWLSVVPIAALAFGLGRILFFKGYQKGAPSRAVGFTLCFYTSALMILSTLGYLVWQQIS